MHELHTMAAGMPADKQGRWSTRTIGMSLVVLALAVGWIGRERAFARDATERVKSGTVSLGDVKMTPHQDLGKVVGQVGIYMSGETAASSKFVTGRFVLEAGKTPHAPHIHVEEEVMIVESGNGDIFCDGKTTKVGPGSTMYTAPNVPHAIVNTGDTPLVFYFMKWAPSGTK